MSEKCKHAMVTWGGQPHFHFIVDKQTRQKKYFPCDKMHGYCMSPVCHRVLVPGDNRPIPE